MILIWQFDLFFDLWQTFSRKNTFIHDTVALKDQDISLYFVETGSIELGDIEKLRR